MVEVKADALEESFEQFGEDGVAGLKAELDALKAKIASGAIRGQRPALDGVKSQSANIFTEQYLRRGIEAGLEVKAIGNSSDSIGGYAVPQEIDEQIDSTLKAISPIRSIANVVKVGSAGYRKLIASGGTPSGWAGYEADRPETGTPTLTEIVPPSGELYANPAASQQMLDDAMFDVEAWLAQEIASEFARAEGAAFVGGTGVNQPLGFLSSPTSAALDGVRPMGTLQTIGTGVAGGFAASDPEDDLIDLVQSLRSPYRQGAVFVMNSATAAEIRKFRTADGAEGAVSQRSASAIGYSSRGIRRRIARERSAFRSANRVLVSHRQCANRGVGRLCGTYCRLRYRRVAFSSAGDGNGRLCEEHANGCGLFRHRLGRRDNSGLKPDRRRSSSGGSEDRADRRSGRGNGRR